MKKKYNDIFYYLTLAAIVILSILYIIDYSILLGKGVAISFNTTGIIISFVVLAYLGFILTWKLKHKNVYTIYLSLIIIMLLLIVMPFISGIDLLNGYYAGTNASLGGYIYVVGFSIALILGITSLFIKNKKLNMLMVVLFLVASGITLIFNINSSSSYLALLKVVVSILLSLLGITEALSR